MFLWTCIKFQSELWHTDQITITCIWKIDGFVYLVSIMDFFSEIIVLTLSVDTAFLKALYPATFEAAKKWTATI